MPGVSSFAFTKARCLSVSFALGIDWRQLYHSPFSTSLYSSQPSITTSTYFLPHLTTQGWVMISWGSATLRQLPPPVIAASPVLTLIQSFICHGHLPHQITICRMVIQIMNDTPRNRPNRRKTVKAVSSQSGLFILFVG